VKRLSKSVIPLLLIGIFSCQILGQQNQTDLSLLRGSQLKSAIHIAGTQKLHGASQRFEMHVGTDYKFKFLTVGDLPEADGFDGKTAWHLNGAGVPHISSYSDRDLTRMVAYVQSGVWACKGSPIDIVSEKGNDLVIKCHDGNTTAKLSLNPETHTVKTLSVWGTSGAETWTFSNYKARSGPPIPTTIIHESGETKDTTTVDQLNLQTEGTLNYGMPQISEEGYKYDLSAETRIEVKRLFGYIFVKPKLDGKDEGWWFLDTGAEIMVIDPEVARTHNMKVVGKDSVAGVVASVMTNFSKGVEFKLGPVTLNNSSYMELDMKPFSEGLGLKLAGICGYDFISRVSLDIDPTKSTIGVYPSGNNALPEGESWTTFLFHGNMPSLVCQFEGNHEGLFSLDTGSGSTVDFFTPTVTKYELLKDRKTSSVMTGGAGGASESKTGTLDWFTFGPKRFLKPKVGFQITTKGGFASPYVDGNIGMGFMSNFRIILDYQKSKLALLESK
jgi:hypothetical protein